MLSAGERAIHAHAEAAIREANERCQDDGRSLPVTHAIGTDAIVTRAISSKPEMRRDPQGQPLHRNSARIDLS